MSDQVNNPILVVGKAEGDDDEFIMLCGRHVFLVYDDVDTVMEFRSPADASEFADAASENTGISVTIRNDVEYLGPAPTN